jgi:hypothetical protein
MFSDRSPDPSELDSYLNSYTLSFFRKISSHWVKIPLGQTPGLCLCFSLTSLATKDFTLPSSILDFNPNSCKGTEFTPDYERHLPCGHRTLLQ